MDMMVSCEFAAFELSVVHNCEHNHTIWHFGVTFTSAHILTVDMEVCIESLNILYLLYAHFYYLRWFAPFFALVFIS